MFKLFHQLLPTQDKLSRLLNEPALCKTCHASPLDLLHAFFSCPSSKAVGDLLLSFVRIVVPGISPQQLLRLDLGPGPAEADQLATILCDLNRFELHLAVQGGQEGVDSVQDERRN